jgi:Flagellar basal body-associated protein
MKKMLPWLITILLSITLIAIVGIILFRSMFNEPAEEKNVEVKVLSAEQRVEVTSELKEFRRNLLDAEYFVMMDFAFQLDSKKTKESFDKLLEIEIRPIISRTLADMTAEEFKGSQGEDALEAKLLNLINPILPKGKLIKVEITNFFISEL